MAIKPIRVSQINSYIKRLLQIDPILKEISVVGEISNLKFHSSGNVYFSLKDESSKINCFMYGSIAEQLQGELQNGVEVVVTGNISVYEPLGNYSLKIIDIEIYGQGKLNLEFEELKLKLQREGLFDEKYKKELPKFPKKIGIITSETGAAVQDIIKIIKGKNEYVDIIIYSSSVQGKNASKDLIKSIKSANSDKNKADVIIIGRGGGSKEELSAFNDEDLARAIFESQIPIVSAVGHETDFSISDFVADKRAETPTAAGEIVVPDIFEIKEYLQELKEQMTFLVYSKLNQLNNRLRISDDKSLEKNLKNIIEYNDLNLKLKRENLLKLVKTKFNDKWHLVNKRKLELEALDPKAVLKRGYSIVLDENRNIIKNAENLSEGMELNISFQDSVVKTKIISIEKDKKVEDGR